jgi:hypothetical protein
MQQTPAAPPDPAHHAAAAASMPSEPRKPLSQRPRTKVLAIVDPATNEAINKDAVEASLELAAKEAEKDSGRTSTDSVIQQQQYAAQMQQNNMNGSGGAIFTNSTVQETSGSRASSVHSQPDAMQRPSVNVAFTQAVVKRKNEPSITQSLSNSASLSDTTTMRLSPTTVASSDDAVKYGYDSSVATTAVGEHNTCL